MFRAIVLLVGFFLVLGSCTQRLICPAYQSAFIHDQPSLSRSYSTVVNDSTPKEYTSSKNRYLIIPETSYRKKIRSMQTIAMKSIHTILPDSLQDDKKPDSTNQVYTKKDSTSKAIDSLKNGQGKDSVYMISVDKEVRVLKYKDKRFHYDSATRKYIVDSARYFVDNIMYTADQDNYMWYFRDVLVLPDVRAALEEEQNKKSGKTAGGKGEKKGGFFKNLFKNPFKKKDSVAAVQRVRTAGAESSDTTTVVVPKKKKFGLFKKKEKVEAVPPKKTDPAKKEEDGF